MKFKSINTTIALNICLTRQSSSVVTMCYYESIYIPCELQHPDFL